MTLGRILPPNPPTPGFEQALMNELRSMIHVPFHSLPIETVIFLWIERGWTDHIGTHQAIGDQIDEQSVDFPVDLVTNPASTPTEPGVCDRVETVDRNAEIVRIGPRQCKSKPVPVTKALNPRRPDRTGTWNPLETELECAVRPVTMRSNQTQCGRRVFPESLFF